MHLGLKLGITKRVFGGSMSCNSFISYLARFDQKITAVEKSQQQFGAQV